MTPQSLSDLGQQAMRDPNLDGIGLSEPDAKYHLFLFLLAKNLQPKQIVELGTYIGESTKYMAKGAPEAAILTIDTDPRAKSHIDPAEYPTITAITANALDYARDYTGPPIDLLFLDVNHDFSLTHSCYEAWKGHIRPGGIMCIDDIHLDKETERFNQYLRNKGVTMESVPGIHATGFGIIRV